MVERNQNSADLCKRMDNRSIFPGITPNNNITDKIEDLKRKEVRHMQRHCKMLEHQILLRKFLNH